MPNIKAILIALCSRPDEYKHRHWAFQYLDTETGHTVSARVSGGESNIKALIRDLKLEPYEVFFMTTELKRADYNARTRKLPVAGCAPRQLAEYITLKLIEQQAG